MSLAAAAIVAVAAGLRFALLGQHSLWADEAFVAWAVGLNWKDLLPALAGADSHPPLYYALVKAWAGIAGTGEVALRAPSACFGTVAVLLTYVLARRVTSQAAGLLAALVAATSPFAIMAAQEARMYAMLSALAAGATLALALSVERRSWPAWGAYAALATLLVYTHYLGFLVVAAHGAWVWSCERAALRPWLGCMLALAILYTPWWATLAARARDVASMERSPSGIVPYLTPDGLLALFAFGGSLFGTATYFGAGTSAPVIHVVALLPFVIVLGWGIATLWPRRRGCGLVGFPPAVTLGAAVPLSLATPVLWPRALSFLVPFYAIFLAQGALELATLGGRRRNPALLVLVAGLLAYSAPVLDQFYGHPAARPYQWRAAAQWVAAEARAGDYFLYVGRASRDSLRYYFRQSYPSRTLVLRRDPRPTFTPATARGLATQVTRLWVVMSTPFDPSHPVVRGQLVPAIGGAFEAISGREFNRVWVYLLVPRRAAPAATAPRAPGGRETPGLP